MIERHKLIDRFRTTRDATESLAAPLSPEDQQLQSMPDCSPAKWHRAHTTWFFETFLLLSRGVEPFDPAFAFLFNSYYDAVGPRHARSKRGMLSRPTAAEVSSYRRTVDERVLELLATMPNEELSGIRPVLELGIAHEEQHQELLLTDILNAFAENPTRPAYRRDGRPANGGRSPAAAGFVEYPGGAFEAGAAPTDAFVFDNETPRHRVWLEPFAIADRLVTVSDWKEFARARGYETPSLWLSDGFDFIRTQCIRAPLYSRLDGDALVVFGLDGEREAGNDEPLSHISFYEADAIATFLGGRLPTEEEWECAALTSASVADGNFRDTGALRPLPAEPAIAAPRQLFGDVWEWTRSSYSPYPGFTVGAGALGEYNGKFMVNQFVLRGGSCFTPRDHVRPTYRNFWHPGTRFQMSGMRLAKSVGAEVSR